MLNIIKTFFENRNLTIKELVSTETECGSWSYSVCLLKNNFNIYAATGIGATQEEAKLFAYQELYAKFCNKTFFLENINIAKKFIELNNLSKGYCLNPDEKMIDYDYLINLPIISHFYKTLLNNDENYISQIFEVLTDNLFIGEPYRNYDESSTIYCDPRILNRVIGNEGMSCDMTLSLAQEKSIYSFLKTQTKQMSVQQNQFEKVVLLDKNLFVNENNLKYLSAMESKGYIIYILDYSYICNSPVIGVLITNPLNYNYTIGFGCNVDIEIALHEAFNDLFTKTNNLAINNNFSIPMKHLSIAENQFLINQVINEIQLSKLPYANPNQKVFQKNYFNDLLKQFHFKVLKVENIFVVQAVNFNSDFSIGLDLETYSKMSKLTKKANIQHLMRLKKQSNIIYSKQDIHNLLSDIYDRQLVIMEEAGFDWYDGFFVGHFEKLDWLNPLPSISFITFILTDFTNYNEDIFTAFMNTPIENKVKYFMTLQSFFLENKYSANEVKQIFKTMFNIEIDDEDINNLQNSKYLFNHIFALPMHEYYNSEEYKNFISTFIL